MIEKLILIRHGETVHNVDGIAQGWNDSALSPRGEQQVAALARRVAAMEVDAIYSSTLNRALSTARAIASLTNHEITTLDDLREMNYGGWEGRSFLDVRKYDEETYRRWIDDGDAPCPNGESHNDVRRRIEAAVAAMRGRNVVAVSHGTAIRIAATALLEIPIGAARHFAQDNASVSIFIRRGERFVLKLWNDTSHCS
ncbi:MAG TPA: histidine phosphatase family protein [Thermoanaerobaculia bacterium]|nr:histidine phosphatase family protein [Thermoanaerobaculia bacterium]